MRKQTAVFCSLFFAGIVLFGGCDLNDARGVSGRRAGNAAHIVINQYYGANYSYNQTTRQEDTVRDTPVSHSFVELYNPSDRDVDLNGYIDMFAVGGNDPGLNDTIDGYENSYQREQSKQKSFRRIDFADADNNEDDFMNDDPDYANVALFRAQAAGLEPGTAYNFRAGGPDGYVTGSFTTAAENPGDFTFIHLSDSQSTNRPKTVAGK